MSTQAPEHDVVVAEHEHWPAPVHTWLVPQVEVFTHFVQPVVGSTWHVCTTPPAAHCLPLTGVQAFVQHVALPAAPEHAPFVHVWVDIWKLQPVVASFAQVTRVDPEHVGPVVPVQTESPTHWQEAPPEGPAHVSCAAHPTGAPNERQPFVPTAHVARPPLTHDFCPCVQVFVHVRPHIALGALPVQTWGDVQGCVVETKRHELASVAHVATVVPLWHIVPLRVQIDVLHVHAAVPAVTVHV